MKTEALLVCLLARFMFWLTLFEDKYISLLNISRGSCVLLCDTRDTEIIPFLQALKPVVTLESRMTGLTKHTLTSD